MINLQRKVLRLTLFFTLSVIYCFPALGSNIRTLIKFESIDVMKEYKERYRDQISFKRLHKELLWFYTSDINDFTPEFTGIKAVEFDTKLLNRPIVLREEMTHRKKPSIIWGVERIGAPEVWREGLDGEGVLVAVLDTGVNFNHPGIKQNMHINVSEYWGEQNVDDDGNGYIDDVYGYNFYNETADVMDEHDHGTHVAGIIAADFAVEGVYGVAPKARILAVKTHDKSGISSKLTVAEGILYAVDEGVDIINCSWSGAPEASIWSELLYDVISYANQKKVLVVASAGNEGRYVDEIKSYPSGYEIENVVSVGGTNFLSDNLSAYSNYGTTNVHIAAPGTAIYSLDSKNGITKMTGTSMAAPHVSGAAAVVIEYLRANRISYSAKDIKDILLRNAEITSGTENKVSSGLLSLRFMTSKFSIEVEND